ncbi:MAG: permease of phosphate ABC transporter [Oscillospiraceae bacterium]|nr:permease of phosphate ABC transporter [Oscillospiraceae bacterium]
MKRLFCAANRYARESDWKTLAALKLCLLSLGVIVGMYLPDGCKKIVLTLCLIVFAATYIPLMSRLLRVLGEEKAEK